MIRVVGDSAKRAVIEVVGVPSSNWSFRNSYAGVSELGGRIEGFKVFDTAGAEIPIRKIAPGQFAASIPATRIRYEVNLDPPVRAVDAARVSWSNEARGLLMLADLLPLPSQEATRATSSGVGADRHEPAPQRLAVRLNLPGGWNVFSNEGQSGSGDFEVTDPDASVFVIGNHLRTSRTTVSGMTLNLIADGEWAFADSEALQMGSDVLKAHSQVFGSMASTRASLILMPFPQAAAERWSAETRGSTVTLLLGRQPSKVAALAQLSGPLTHELFHLWVPNALALEGDYDWFYEGFTIYQAARTGVRLGWLTFQDFLNAIGRAYDAYTAGLDRDRWSLVEASQRRWTVGESVVYQKSMLVAFLYDLRLRNQTRDKRSLDDVYRELFRQHHSVSSEITRAGEVEQRRDGNEAVLSALSDGLAMQNFAGAFVRRPVAIDLAAELAAFGLRAERIGLRTHLTVNEKLTRQQRDLLRELGYNDPVRSTQRKQH